MTVVCSKILTLYDMVGINDTNWVNQFIKVVRHILSVTDLGMRALFPKLAQKIGKRGLSLIYSLFNHSEADIDQITNLMLHE